MAVTERSEKVEILEDSTAAMADSAETFSEIAGKLSEKYRSEK